MPSRSDRRLTIPRAARFGAALSLALAACATSAAHETAAPIETAEPSASDAGVGPDASAEVADAGSVDASSDGGGASKTSPAMAAVDADAGTPECPAPGMARIGRYCIDKWEAHLVARGPDGGYAPLPPNERPPEGVRFEARSDPGGYPQAYISRVEAKAACQNAGKRLCSMREWRRSCAGPAGAHYPYGFKLKRERCNIGKPHLLQIRFGADARHWTYENFNDPSLDTEEGFLAKSGEYDGCHGESGVYDTAGNLHEWVSDTVDEAFVQRLELDNVERKKQPWKFHNAVFVGGFFSTTDQHGPGCLFTTFAHESTYHDYSIGFRCCAASNVVEEEKPKKKPKKKGP